LNQIFILQIFYLNEVINIYIVFFSTNDVFRAEDILNAAAIECKIVPTPVTDKAYCGVCIQTDEEEAKKLMGDMEFNIIG
jgi:hypothetical protein